MTSLLLCYNNSTGNFNTGISGRLGSEIVRHGMQHHSSSDDFSSREPRRQKDGKSMPVGTKKRWQISGMVRMIAVIWVVVGQCIGKRVRKVSGALAATVDVKSKHRISANRVTAWQVAKIGSH